ncbi:DUF5753 domain-containing protein [Actinoplanes sp. TFC3]|uniref:DUF5753 domain-containing protein n=1 Tax=Actinoplanes sp. TFC3 TaxID=1710355 RepID=UPI000833061F|nr:DUF5753 domain-containing protein [Actinoplanes sp. TFC3]
MEWVSDAYARLVELEREAASIQQNQPLYVPGLLQTEQYATALVAGVLGLPSQAPGVAQRVQLRRQRSEAFLQRLEGANPPALTSVIDESVLRRRVGGPATMRAQLDHLLEISARYPSVRLAVPSLDSDAHPGMTGSFEIFDTAVFFETPGYDRLAEDPETVQLYRQRFASLLAAADAGEKASERLERLSVTIL